MTLETAIRNHYAEINVWEVLGWAALETDDGPVSVIPSESNHSGEDCDIIVVDDVSYDVFVHTPYVWTKDDAEMAEVRDLEGRFFARKAD